jgi:hypothetical protein
MTSNTDDLYNEIMKNKPNEVRLVLSKIDEILAMINRQHKVDRS